MKKQGILPITFVDPSDYDRIREMDRISILGLQELAPDRPIECVLHHDDGTSEAVQLKHSLNEMQISWFRAGSALNLLNVTN